MKTKTCTKCKKEKSLDEFSPNKQGRYGKQSYCKKCFRVRAAKWRKQNPEESKKRSRRYNWKDAGINCNDKLYNRLFNEQGGCCAICGKHQSKLKKGLSVDHKHISGKIRRLLCGVCNTTLGYYEKFINDEELVERFNQYLKMYE